MPVNVSGLTRSVKQGSGFTKPTPCSHDHPSQDLWHGGWNQNFLMVSDLVAPRPREPSLYSIGKERIALLVSVVINGIERIEMVKAPATMFQLIPRPHNEDQVAEQTNNDGWQGRK